MSEREPELFRVTEASGRVWMKGERWPDRSDGELGTLRAFEAKVRGVMAGAPNPDAALSLIHRALDELSRGTALPVRAVTLDYVEPETEGSVEAQVSAVVDTFSNRVRLLVAEAGREEFDEAVDVFSEDVTSIVQRLGPNTPPVVEIVGLPDPGTDMHKENAAVRATLFLNGTYMEEVIDLKGFLLSLKEFGGQNQTT